MPFYFRKSVSAGPFRFNFLQGGVGMSVGVKGLRIGTGPRGHYVQAGTGGFYYRASLGGVTASGRTQSMRTRSPSLPVSPAMPDGMTQVTSGEVLAMQDAAFADLLAEINEKHGKMRFSVLGSVTAAAIGVFAMMAGGAAAIGVLLLIPIAWAIGAWLDSFKRAAVIFYDLEETAQARFVEICAAFDKLAACSGAWHIEAGQVVRDLTTWKREAGASHLVKRTATRLNYALPPIVKSNVTPPALRVRKRTIYFLPDVALIHDATGFGAVGYDALRVSFQPSNFIETGAAPRDATVIDHTWEHPNKKGGPDRRFKSNRRLPVCRYEAMHLSSASGVNELLEFSRVGFVGPLAAAFKAVAVNRSIGERPMLTHGR
jgi:hypothetical protein